MTVDLCLRGGRVFDVFSGTFRRLDVSIAAGRIVSLTQRAARETIDARRLWIVPGLVDAHVHIESSHLSPAQFARAVVPRGTTAVIADPHEVANVCGLAGVRAFLAAMRGLPLRVFLMAPSCVPAAPFGTAAARLGPSEVAEMLSWEGALGLGEMMNVPGVLQGDPDVLAKLRLAAGRPIDGHAPGLRGDDLADYLVAGPRTDHEATTFAEAEEKLFSGMHILIREATAARNLRDLLPLLTDHSAPFVHFCTDDRSAETLDSDGHIDAIVRAAVDAGAPLERVLAAATIHAARAYGLRDLGAIAPGYQADVVLFSDLRGCRPREVYVAGRLVAREGELVALAPEARLDELRDTVHVRRFEARDLRVPLPSSPRSLLRVIGVVAHQILTESHEAAPRIVDGAACADVDRDLLKAAVVERRNASGKIGLGFVSGLGLRRGAIATTVAHDAHPLVVVGASDADMVLAARTVIASGGGQAVVADGQVLAALGLPLAGIMSPQSVHEVAAAEAALRAAAQSLGSELPDPFATLSFLALPVIPHLRLTDEGLVDVDRFALVPLYVE
jgi:adenine deaminase